MDTVILSIFLFVFLICTFIHPSKQECNERCEDRNVVVRGKCNSRTGKCRCPWGWTGPNSDYVYGALNKIDADYCDRGCFYNHHHKNPECALAKQQSPGAPGSNPQFSCHGHCENAPLNYGSRCVAENRCLCHWGYTGPNAIYIQDPNHQYYGKVVADYCTVECQYTHQHRNPLCADEP